MNIDLRKLRAFVAAGRHCSFGRAAEELRLTQSAVSVAVRRLEADLGVRLLDRTTRSVRPTAAGERLLAVAGRLIAELDAAVSEVREDASNRRGRVVVSCLPSVATRLLPAAIAAARRAYPELDVVVQDTSAEEVLRLVASGAADFGISNKPVDGAGLCIRPLVRDPFCLVCRRDDPLARDETVPWQRIGSRDLVLPAAGTGSRRPIDEALSRQGIVPGRIAGLAHPAAVAGMVEAGLGVAILPELAAPPADHPVLATRLLTDPEVEREIILLHRRDRSLSPPAEAFLVLIGDRFGERLQADPPGSSAMPCHRARGASGTVAASGRKPSAR